MLLFGKSSIHRKLLMVIFCTSLLGLTIASLAFESYEKASFRMSMVSALTSDADTLGLATAASLAFNDRKSAQELLETVRAETNIVIVTLYDKREEVFAEYRRTGVAAGFQSPRWKNEGASFEADSLTLTRSISVGGEKVGSIVFVSDLGALHARTANYTEISALVILVSAFPPFLLPSRLVPPTPYPIPHL